MMKFIFTLCFIIASTFVYSQIDAFTIVGKKRTEVENKFSFGAFLKFSYPISDADELTAELAILGLDGYNIGFLPMKAGYRYTLNRSGYGFYIEPQVGYAIGGDYDEQANGFVGSANFGYLFQPLGGIRFDLALRYENIFTPLGTYSFLGIRIAHNFSFKKRDDY